MNKITRMMISLLLVLSIANCVMLGALTVTFVKTVKYVTEMNIPGMIKDLQDQIDDNNATLDMTQDMLDEWNEFHDQNLTMEDIKEQDVTKPEVEEKPIQLNLVSDPRDVTKPSNATAEELNRTIQNTCNWMYTYNPNLGQLYYELEQKHGINAYFALAVSYSEVGTREMSNLAKNHNNIYGLMGKSYDSIEDCIDYFFRLIKNYYVGEGRYSVEEISEKYCLSNPTWIKNVSTFMNKLPNSSR